MTRLSPFKTQFAAAKATRFSSRTRSSSRLTRAARGRRLHLERLEDRVVLTAGDLDPTFGIGGWSLTDFPSSVSTNDSGRGVAIQQLDGKIIVAGDKQSNLPPPTH